LLTAGFLQAKKLFKSTILYIATMLKIMLNVKIAWAVLKYSTPSIITGGKYERGEIITVLFIF
jgi:hypothetical protein